MKTKTTSTAKAATPTTKPETKPVTKSETKPVTDTKPVTPAPKVAPVAFTRLVAAAETLKANPRLTLDEATKRADALWMKRNAGKASNLKEQKQSTERVLVIMKVFNLV